MAKPSTGEGIRKTWRVVSNFNSILNEMKIAPFFLYCPNLLKKQVLGQISIYIRTVLLGRESCVQNASTCRQ